MSDSRSRSLVSVVLPAPERTDESLRADPPGMCSENSSKTLSDASASSYQKLRFSKSMLPDVTRKVGGVLHV